MHTFERFGASVNSKGHLVFAGHDVVELANEYGTPLYIYDEDHIRYQCRSFREAVESGAKPGKVAYAGKAFLTTAMARIVDQEGLHLDVVSGGELYTAIAAGFPMHRVEFNGNNKSIEELTMAIEHGVGRIIVDNFDELDLLRGLLQRLDRRQAILLRVAPGIEAHTHESIRTGQQDSKFGFDLEAGDVIRAVEQVLSDRRLDLLGLHCHIGSQIFDAQPFVDAASIMLELVAAIHRQTGYLCQELNLGGGFGIRYTPEEEPPAPAAVLDRVRQTMADWSEESGLEQPQLGIEPGRSIVGQAGLAVYTVGSQKRVEGLLPYVAVDGGMADNMRPALYDAEYYAVLADDPLRAPEEKVHLVGRYCESGDVLIKQIDMPRLKRGDRIAVFSSGAYHYSMSSNYNRFPRPMILLAGKGGVAPIVQRESHEDLIRHDRLPDWLADRKMEA